MRRDESRLYKGAIIVRRRTAGSRERPARGGGCDACPGFDSPRPTKV
nr:MAG TPA: hypothetical protein [Caudoviricetes sp.]